MYFYFILDSDYRCLGLSKSLVIVSNSFHVIGGSATSPGVLLLSFTTIPTITADTLKVLLV